VIKSGYATTDPVSAEPVSPIWHGAVRSNYRRDIACWL
jgi:hypothetical protein